MSQKEDDQTEEYYSVEEVAELIERLDEITLTKLYRIASTLKMIYRYDNRSLVHDVIVKLLSGERQWKKGYTIYTVFRNLCSSMLSHFVEKNKTVISLNLKDEKGNELIESIPSGLTNQEYQLVLADLREYILNILEDDPIARDLVEGRMLGYEKSDSLELLDITDKEYETKWKKIRRRLQKNIEEDWYVKSGNSVFASKKSG